MHGNESVNYINKIKNNNDIKIIKKIGINNKEDTLLSKEFTLADYILFDYKPIYDEELPGGNAKKFNWSLLENRKIHKPWFISGGININNINEIQKNLIPYGIDISSGVEDLPGIKNSKKIIEIMRKINA